MENAAALVAEGAAVSIPDGELTGERLLDTIAALTGDQLRAMARASAAAGRPDAAQRVLSVVREVARR